MRHIAHCAWLAAIAVPAVHSAPAPAAPAVIVAPIEARMHEPVRLQVRGLRPGQSAIVRADLIDDRKQAWQSEARYRADRRGRIDMRTASALSGTYAGVDASGLFWSMRPVGVDGAAFVKRAASDPRHSLVPVLDRKRLFPVTITVVIEGRPVAKAIVRRGWTDPRVRETEVADGDLRGILYEPVGAKARRGIVLITGSGGGVDRDWAPLLASRGHAVLALGYFGYKDRPRFPAELPIEYFAESLRWLQARLGHARIGMVGVSRGTEAAFLTAAHYPGLVRAIVAVAPGHLSTPGFHPEKGLNVSTWSLAGKPVAFSPFPAFSLADLKARHSNPENPLRQAEWYAEMYARKGEDVRFAIPVERMRAPLLMLSGSADAIWPSELSGKYVAGRLARARYPFAVRHRVLDGAGHGIWMSPDSVTTYAHLDYHGLAQAFTTSGGRPAANARGAGQAFWETDAFLRKHLK